ncbi:hypothetical protein [Mucilaginibacter ginsenosidivorax]|uniref:Trypsin-like peptidase domain-containing protein n=1 Tax=Mucilaginibacter ginsenosidivorax TaxID=862126 RepID=A0A5B8W264_9SPHI|nr:hypothetical protein [Mucilaginibacter ginsenosidivorax]QEC77022.1 hypothetical protein FSB76_14115 [Mucilaginibacter ginsenosidivorax]
MFNNTALDVVIGLVLVYLLYSLLITILGELLATWLGLRARILRISIERMLNDGLDLKKAGDKWHNKVSSAISRFFLKEPPSFSSSFAGLFYNYPSIKYLAKLEPAQAFIFGQTKPSYITPDNFATTAINILCDHGTGATKYDQLVFSLENNTLSIEPETIKQLRNIYNLSGKDLDTYKAGLIAWYNETQDRTNGWYKRKISFILFWVGFLLAFAFNVDSIKIAHILSKDKDARTQLVNMGIALTKDSARYKGFVNGNDTIPSRAVIDSGFARVSKDIGAANFILGLGWDFSEIKIDSTVTDGVPDFKYYKKYRADINATTKNIHDIRAIASRRRDSVVSLKQEIRRLAQDTTLKKRQLSYLKPADLTTAKAILFKEIDSISNKYVTFFHIQSNIKTDSDKIIPQITLLNNVRDSVNKKAGKRYISLLSVKYDDAKQVAVITGTRHLSFGEKTGKFFCTGLFSWSFWGFIITGFALSLGAPFWFGLLNKLVALRGAGVKPKDDTDLLADPAAAKADKPEVEKPIVIQKLIDTDPVASAVRELRYRYGNYPGVLSIGQGFKWVTEKVDGKDKESKVEAVEIHVIGNVLATMQAEIKDGNYHGVPVNVMANTIITAHLNAGDTIVNQTSIGTLGCFVKNKKTTGKIYLMSCWHVLKHKNDMIDSGLNTGVAKVLEGAIGPTMDIGFAEILISGQFDNTLIKISQDFRAVTLNDAKNELPVFFHGAFLGRQSDAVIYNHVVDDQKIFHSDTGQNHLMSDLFSITRYKPNTKIPESPSSKGDSGAVVVDKEGHPVGIVVGGDESFTYVVKLSNVFAPNSPYSTYYIPF